MYQLFPQKHYSNNFDNTVTMKKIVSLVIALLMGYNVMSQNMTTMGTDFWVCCNTKRIEANILSYSTFICITSPRPCQATIYNNYTHRDTTLSISPGSISYLTNLFDSFPRDRSSIIHDLYVHISSTDSISVFFCDHLTTFEITNVLPTQTLRSDYLIQIYPSVPTLAEPFAQGYFNVIAIEDSTWISVNVMGDVDDTCGLGSQYTFLLPHAGDCHQVLSTPTGDISGSRVTALNGKKIAVFQGNSATKVPVSSNQYMGGFLLEQAIPTCYWGRHFFVTKTKKPTPDRVRITALHDSCVIKVNNNNVTTINEGETYEYEANSPGDVDYVVTSKQAHIGLYTAIEPAPRYQHCTMLNILPWEQAAEAITFCNPNTIIRGGQINPSDSMHLDIVTKSNEIDYIFFDSIAIDSFFSTIPHNTDFSHACFKISTGYHSIYTTEGSGFTASLNWVNAGDVGHSFSAGSALRDTQNSLVIGNTEMVTTLDTIAFCFGSTVPMRVESLFTADSVVWFLNQTPSISSFSRIGAGTHLQYPFTAPGLYHVMAIAYATCTGCYRQIDTLQGFVIILPIDTSYSDSIFCGNSYSWLDSAYTDGQQIRRTFHATNGCDSIDVLTLHSMPTTSTVVDTIDACDSIALLGSTYINDAVIPFDTLHNIYGCDSILYHDLHIYQSYHTTQYVTIRDTTTFSWIDGNTYSTSTDSPVFFMQSVHGCDSIINLHLDVRPIPVTPVDSSAIWIPNAFTPDEETNNRFAILCNDIINAHVDIYNRQGLLVTSFDGLLSSWDGTFKGTPCPQGTYIVIVTYTTKATPLYSNYRTASVTLIR